jgi:hypothetical protein
MYRKRKIFLQSLALISGFNNTQEKNAMFEVSQKGGVKTKNKKCDPDDHQHQRMHFMFPDPVRPMRNFFCKVVTGKFPPQILYCYLTKKKILSSIKKKQIRSMLICKYCTLYSANCETVKSFMLENPPEDV